MFPWNEILVEVLLVIHKYFQGNVEFDFTPQSLNIAKPILRQGHGFNIPKLREYYDVSLDKMRNGTTEFTPNEVKVNSPNSYTCSYKVTLGVEDLVNKLRLHESSNITAEFIDNKGFLLSFLFLCKVWMGLYTKVPSILEKKKRNYSDEIIVYPSVTQQEEPELQIYYDSNIDLHDEVLRMFYTPYYNNKFCTDLLTYAAGNDLWDFRAPENTNEAWDQSDLHYIEVVFPKNDDFIDSLLMLVLLFKEYYISGNLKVCLHNDFKSSNLSEFDDCEIMYEFID